MAAFYGARVFTSTYAFFNAIGGYLNAFSMAQFAATSLNALAPDYVSENIDDAEWKRSILHALALYFFLSRLKAYVNSNLANIFEPEGYMEDLLSGKWKTYPRKVFVKVFPYIFFNAVNARFNTINTIDAFNKHALENISSTLAITGVGTDILSALSVASTVVNFTLVNVPAMHKLHEKESQSATDKPVKDEEADYAEKVPGCYRFRHCIKTAFAIDSLATGAVSSTALSSAAHKIFGVDEQHMATKIVTSTVAGFFVTYNTYASDVDAFKKELTKRINEKLSSSASAGLKRNSLHSPRFVLPSAEMDGENHSSSASYTRL